MGCIMGCVIGLIMGRFYDRRTMMVIYIFQDDSEICRDVYKRQIPPEVLEELQKNHRSRAKER